MVDASANGALLSKFYNDSYDILEMIAFNSYQWPSTRQVIVEGAIKVHNIDVLTALSAQVALLTDIVKVISIAPTFVNYTIQAFVNQITEVSCVY